MLRRSFNAVNLIMVGDCVGLIRAPDAESVGFIPMDSPYLVNYRDRSGQDKLTIEVVIPVPVRPVRV